MANQLGIYDPIFYAQEALITLENQLGLANAVHRGYDKDPAQKGSTISIKGPGTFSAQAMPITSDQDIDTRQVDIVVDQWEGVRFGLSDKDLSATQEEIIQDHIRPATVAVAEKVDATLVGLFDSFPWYVAASDPATVDNIIDVRKAMFDNKVPGSPRFLMVDGKVESDFLKLQTFHAANESSDGEMTQREGFLGRKFGFSIFAQQSVPSHTAGSLTAGTSVVLDAAVAEDATEMVFTDSSGTPSLTGTVKAGDTFVVAGNTQRYVVTEDASASSNKITVKISPEAAQAYSAGDGVTLRQVDATLNCGFHRNAMALAMAPLSDLGNQAGARIGVASDPLTNLSLRSRLWYDGDNASVSVGIDALWGVKTLDPNLAVRLEQ